MWRWKAATRGDLDVQINGAMLTDRCLMLSVICQDAGCNMRTMRNNLFHLWCLACVLGGLVACCAWADPPGEERDYDHARHALNRGEVRPIADILALVAAQVPGEVVAVEFEHRGRNEDRHGEPCWFYELKILTGDGHLLEVRVDAATGRILDVEED